jgi:hypothetical protein
VEEESIQRNTFMQTAMKNIWMLKHRIKNVFICVWGEGGAIGDEELDSAIKEGRFVFHTVAYNQSLQLMDSTMTIIRKLLNQNSYVHKLNFELLW